MESTESTKAAKGTKRGKKSGRPFGGKKKLYDVVAVRIANNQVQQQFNAQGLELTKGNAVVVETPKGPAVGIVTSEVNRRVLTSGSVKRVLRLLDGTDSRNDEHNTQKQETAAQYALERIRGRKLPMKLIRVEYLHDSSKAVFYFSADGRIDFRDLVKDLAGHLRTRIEMRQVGVRDGARMVGGIGTCGRELCCSTFLQGFAPVSIRMAKDQGLTLNPKKVSGMCGRLMCCLVYEQQVYRKAKSGMPRTGKLVWTALGRGVVRSVDVIADEVTVRLDDGPTERFARRSVMLEGPEQVPTRAKVEPEPAAAAQQLASGPEDILRMALESSAGDGDYLWSGSDAEAEDPTEDDQKPKRRRSRRRRARAGQPGSDAEATQTPAPEGSDKPAAKPKSSDGGDGKKPPRARRRRRSKPGEGPRSGARGQAESDGATKSSAPRSEQGKPAASGEAAAAPQGDGKTGARRRRRRRGRRGGSSGGGDKGESS